MLKFNRKGSHFLKRCFSSRTQTKPAANVRQADRFLFPLKCRGFRSFVYKYTETSFTYKTSTQDFIFCLIYYIFTAHLKSPTLYYRRLRNLGQLDFRMNPRDFLRFQPLSYWKNLWPALFHTLPTTLDFKCQHIITSILKHSRLRTKK